VERLLRGVDRESQGRAGKEIRRKGREKNERERRRDGRKVQRKELRVRVVKYIV
jgi:hypothetical protein